VAAKPSIHDWLPLALTLAASAAWLVFSGLYVRSLGHDLLTLSPTEAAGLFAGIGGPLAALWLFLAVSEQRYRINRLNQGLSEIMSQHRHALQLAETQTRALVAFQAQAERAQAADARALVLRDLASSAAVLAERLGVIRREDVDVAWARFGSGDTSAFVQPFLNYIVSHPEIGERLAEVVVRDPVAAMALRSYVWRFDKLTATLDDKLVRDVLEEGPLGRAFRLFKPAAEVTETAAHKGSTDTFAEAEPADA
jgi:hypothetical protein